VILLDICYGATGNYWLETIYGNSPKIIHIYSSYGYRTEDPTADWLVKEKMFAVSILRRLVKRF
jgi:hypothetical protein